jgi:hypothetical protein
VLGSRTDKDAMRTAADKFREDLGKRIRWWRTEFDIDHFTIAGVLMDVTIDTLIYDELFDEDEVEDEDDDGDDEEI